MERDLPSGASDAHLFTSRAHAIANLRRCATEDLRADLVMRRDAAFAVRHCRLDCYRLLMGQPPEGEMPDGLVDTFRAHAQHVRGAQRRYVQLSRHDLVRAAALSREFAQGITEAIYQHRLDQARAHHEAEVLDGTLDISALPATKPRL
ncbi:hypothetical protein [Luteibacter sp. CQ10]|uniref:hypothetical protein n=1 Tax=Luteibacter sp. CQ10 TaxID=2805821 RepID=UPI0034A1D6BA